MVDRCTQYEQSPLIHLRYITTNKIYEIMDINVTFWHRAQVYFTYIKSPLWLVTVPTMNKRPMGLDALLIKLLHRRNFHNFGRDPT